MTAYTRPYTNPSTNEDRTEALRNDARLRKGDREPTSYHRLASLGDDLGGRFAAEAGEEAATKYPEQSEGPW